DWYRRWKYYSARLTHPATLFLILFISVFYEAKCIASHKIYGEWTISRYPSRRDLIFIVRLRSSSSKLAYDSRGSHKEVKVGEVRSTTALSVFGRPSVSDPALAVTVILWLLMPSALGGMSYGRASGGWRRREREPAFLRKCLIDVPSCGLAANMISNSDWPMDC
ncbi:unnamed protein product, partial [Mycena citricolor]